MQVFQIFQVPTKKGKKSNNCQLATGYKKFKFNVWNVYLFLKDREREKERDRERQREREREREERMSLEGAERD